MRIERTGPRTFRAEIDPLALLLVDLHTIAGRRRWCAVVETYDPAPGLDLAETTPAGRALGPEFRSIADLRSWARDPATQQAAEAIVRDLRDAGRGPDPT